MKKFMIFFLIVFVFICTGCQFVTTEKPKSAYDIACDHGFQGSEEEWLASLKGEKGDLNISDLYATAQANGYTGTLEEWLASLKGATGEKGETIDLVEVYEALTKRGEIDCSFLEFVQTYLNVNLAKNNKEVIAKALMSTVLVVASAYPKEKWDENSSGQTGAGVIYKLDKDNGDAFIITNYHVVFDSDDTKAVINNLYVYFYGKQLVDYLTSAEFVGGSATYDIAVLKISNCDILKNSDYLAATIADSDNVAVGESAIAIGNPESDGFSVTEGIICVDSEQISMKPSSTVHISTPTISMRVMRIDTPVNSGNSGGGLYNSNGELIGIVNAKIKSSDVENIGYAIPSTLAISVANNIIDNCYQKENKYVMKCLMGVTIATTDSMVSYDKNTGSVKIIETVTVQDVSENSIAYGHIQTGDIIVSFELRGKVYDVTRKHIIVEACLNARVGDVSKTVIIRNGVKMTVEMTFNSATIIG